MRRDFLAIARGFSDLKDWGLGWVETIGTLYHLNRQRLAAWQTGTQTQSAAFQQAQAALKNHLQHMKARCDTCLQSDQPDSEHSLHDEQRKVVSSLQNHWQGLTVFLDHPQVPMDNNAAERAIRNPVTGRKNYYGSGSLGSAKLAAMMFSIFQTLALWQINPRHWLRTYLQACADKGSQAPDDIKPFLPWAMDAARRQQLSRPPDTSNLTPR